MFGRNLRRYSPIGAWFVIALVARAQSELEWLKDWSQGPPLMYDGSIGFSHRLRGPGIDFLYRLMFGTSFSIV